MVSQVTCKALLYVTHCHKLCLLVLSFHTSVHVSPAHYMHASTCTHRKRQIPLFQTGKSTRQTVACFVNRQQYNPVLTGKQTAIQSCADCHRLQPVQPHSDQLERPLHTDCCQHDKTKNGECTCSLGSFNPCSVSFYPRK